MKKLPEIYKNQVIKSTNQNYNYQKLDTDKIIIPENKKVSLDKEKVLKQVFKNKTGAYTKKVQIVTREKVLNTRLIHQTEQEVLTIDNEKIPIEEILSIKII